MSDEISRTVTFNQGAPSRVQSAGGHFARWCLVIFGGAACLALAIVSGYFNVRFSQRLATSWHEMIAWTTFAIGTDVFNATMPIAYGELRQRKEQFWTAVSFGLWLLAFSWSLVAAFGYAVSSRDHHAAEATTSIESRADARAMIETRRKQLAALGTVRPARVVQAEIDAEYRRLGVAPSRCARVTDWSDRHCRTAWGLATELERSTSAEKLAAEIDRERQRLDGVKVVGTVADPQTAAVEFLTGLPQRISDIIVAAAAALMLTLFASFGPAAVWNGARALRELPEDEPGPAEQPLDTMPLLGTLEHGFARWAPEHIEIETGSLMTSQQAYGEYRNWAPFHQCETGTKESFGKLLAAYAASQGIQGKRGSHTMKYPGLSLRKGKVSTLLQAAQ